MKKLKLALATVLPSLLLVASAIPVAAGEHVSNPPSTYVNANFGPDFWRSPSRLDFDSNTAHAHARRIGSGAQFSASANMDPNETSAAYSSYDVGTVNKVNPAEELTNVTVTAKTLSLSGTAHFAMNLWFDSSHNGEYFAWDNNGKLTSLDGDIYALGPCIGTGCTQTGKTLALDENTPLFVIPGCPANVITLADINAGLCSTIPANTHVAVWVGIDIQRLTIGSGSATIRSGECGNGHGDGDFEDRDGHKHHGQFHGNSCDNGGSSARDDDDHGNHFESNSVSSSTFTDDQDSQTLTMVGTGLDNGLPVAFTLVVIDYGGLAPDIYNLTLTDGRTFLGTLVSGSVQFE